MFADIVSRADMRMIDARCAACFSPESLEGYRIGYQPVGQQLQCYFAAQATSSAR
jgi:hypothetical protein